VRSEVDGPSKRYEAAGGPSPRMDRRVLAEDAAAQVIEFAEGELGFEAFFRAESPGLYRRLWLITGNRSEAEDIIDLDGPGEAKR